MTTIIMVAILFCFSDEKRTKMKNKSKILKSKKEFENCARSVEAEMMELSLRDLLSSWVNGLERRFL